MKVTQQDIARQTGLDVSSVNKILNNVQGPVFTAKTKNLVKQTAKRLGYQQRPDCKSKLRQVLEELFPPGVGADVLASTRGISLQRVLEIKDLIRRAGGAAIVLFVLRCIVS